MKMTNAHYDDLKSRVEKLAESIPGHKQALLNAPGVKDINKRDLWDTFHATKIMDSYRYQDFDYLDTHIETAMKSIFKDLGI